MIDHYALHDIAKLTDRYGLAAGVPKGVKPRYNITLTQPAPMIVSHDGNAELRTMGWGLLAKGSKDSNSVFRYKTHNVRSEKVFTKASWDTAVRTHRCIIPMNGFYMLRRDNGEAYYFTSPTGSVYSVAGLYSSWEDSDGATRESFAMLTIDSNQAMPLPFGTMPVLLHKEDEAEWIDPNINDMSSIIRCMRPFEGGVLKYQKASSDVQSAKNDYSELLKTS